MTDDEVLDVIQRVVRTETGNPSTVVTRATTAADVPGWDSLTHGLLMLSLEAEFGTKIDIEKTYQATNVGELIPIVRPISGGES